MGRRDQRPARRAVFDQGGHAADAALTGRGITPRRGGRGERRKGEIQTQKRGHSVMPLALSKARAPPDRSDERRGDAIRSPSASEPTGAADQGFLPASS